MKPSDFLTIAISVVAVLIVVAGAVGTWAALRVGKNTGVVSQFRDAAASSEALARSYKSQMDNQEYQITDLQRQLSDRDKEIKVLQGQMDIMKDLVTGRPAFDEISRHLEDLVVRVDSRLSEALAQVNENRTEIRGVHEAVEAIAISLSRSGVRGVRGQRANTGDDSRTG